LRITNIDTLSAFCDRLVTERIKHYFFEKDGKDDLVQHQEIIIKEIKSKLSQLFIESFSEDEYEYMGEKRTFTLDGLIQQLDELVVNDILIGEGDRRRLDEIKKEHPSLEVILENEKLTRISNENRSKNKNLIDQYFSDLW